jgi:hypothetical protein
MYLVLALFLQPLMLALSVGPDVSMPSPWVEKPREGTVVLATADHLVMRLRTWDVQGGTTYHYRLARRALVTCDGMLCNLEDLRPGQRVRVTALAEGRLVPGKPHRGPRRPIGFSCRHRDDNTKPRIPVAIATITPSRAPIGFATGGAP